MPHLKAYLPALLGACFVLLSCCVSGQKQDVVYHISKKYDVSNLFGTWRGALPERHGPDSTIFDYSFHNNMTCDLVLKSSRHDTAGVQIPVQYVFFLQTDTIVFRSIEHDNINRAQILKLEKDFLRWVVLMDAGGRGAIMEFRKIASGR